MSASVIAEKWRAEHGYTDRGGVIVIHDGIVSSWVNELRDPEHWEPGCTAIDVAGNQWVSVGGNRQRGAERWQPV
jgi:hypothetical protein